MKESQLRALIESEIRSMLTEKFASKNMTKAFKRLNSSDKKMFDALSRKYKIAWDKIDDPAVRHIKNPSSIKGAPDTLILWFTNSDKLTGPEGDWDTLDVDKGLLAVTHGKQSISFGNTVQTAKPGKATQAGESGNVSRYFNSFKRIAQFADEAYVVYYGTAMSRNYVGNVQITRAQQKQGALALQSANHVLTANRRRYDAELKKKAATLGLKGASAFMDKIYALFESEIKKKTELLKKGNWDTSWTSGYTVAKRAFENASELYERLLNDIEEHKKRKDQDGDDWKDRYFKSRQADSIKAIKEQYLKVKKELSKHKPAMKFESINESVSPAKAADVIFTKLAASKLIGKQHKKAATNLLTYMIARRSFKVSDPKIVAGFLFQDLAGAKLIDKQNRSRAVGVIAGLITSMKLESVNEVINENKYVVIDPRGNASPIGSKMQGLQFIKDKKGYHVVLAKNAKAARRAIEKAGGKSHSAKVYAQMYNMMREGNSDVAGMMKMAAQAVKITKQPRHVGKTYLKSLAKDLAKNAKDYVDYSQDDWVEDLENWIADRG